MALRIIAVDGDAAHAVRRGAIGDMGDGRAVLVARALRKAVILAKENDRQLPQRRHVERLVECPDVGSAVAEIAQRHAAIALQLRRQREAVGDRQTAPHHAGGHHDSGLRISDVHRAALALARAGCLAGILGDHLPQRHALRQLVVHAAISRDQIIGRLEIHAHRRRQDLLAPGRVIDRRHPSGRNQRAHALVEQLNQQRLAVNIQQYLGTEPVRLGHWHCSSPPPDAIAQR
jgi:hypothetical protein